MRFITTVVLLGLSVAAVAALARRDKSAASSPTPDELSQITMASIVRIDIEPDVHLEKRSNEWSLPGNWPVRTFDADHIAEVLASVNSRFSPIESNDLRQFGLDPAQHPLVVKVTVQRDGGEKTIALTLAQPQDWTGNPFTRPTYARINDRPEIFRLAPGLIAQMRVRSDDLLRRQLFPDTMRVKFPVAAAVIGGDADLPPPAEALANIQELAVTGPDGSFTLQRSPANAAWLDGHTAGPLQVSADKLASVWQLSAPIADRPDPEKLRGVLAAVPELWAEQFVEETDPVKTGLDKPERTVHVKSAHGELAVQIGKVSRVREIKQPQPPPSPFGQPQPPVPPIREEYRYAKLPNHPRVFEVRADRFSDLFVKPAELRDPKVARFQPADVTQFDLTLQDRTISFAKQKDETGREVWKITAPVAAPADAAKIGELLDKLAGLQARAEDVVDSPDAKAYGLAADDKVATAKLQLKEEVPGPTPDAPKVATSRTLTFRLGKHDVAAKKVFLQLKDSSRVNAVADDVLKLIDRPVLAYRSRRVLDIPLHQVASVAVARQSDPYTLTQAGGVWSLSLPVAAKADTGKSAAMFSDLSRLEATEFVNFAPTPEELAKYGLTEPTARLTLAFTEASKAPETLLIGKLRDGKPEVYAKLASMPEVFALSQQLKETLEQPSVAFRPLQLWMAMAPLVSQISVERAKESFTVMRDGPIWRITGPFTTTAFLPAVQPLLDAAASPRADRYESHTDAELAKFGLEPPAVVLRVKLDTGERVLQLGAAAGSDGARYAKLADQPGVFVLPAATANAIDKSALDLLDRRMFNFDPRELVGIRRMMADRELLVEKKDRTWQITKPATAAADIFVLMSLAEKLSSLRAQRLAAFAATDLKPFGLDAPTATVDLSLAGPDGQARTMTLKLGAAVPEGRFACLESGMVYVVPDAMAAQLLAEPVQFRDRTIVPAVDLDQVDGLTVESAGTTLVLTKADVGWQITGQPGQTASADAVNELLSALSGVRADKYVTEDKSDLKQFGLDAPQRSITFRTRGGQSTTLHLGKQDDAKRHFVRVADRPDIVAVLSEADGAKLWKISADLFTK